MDLLHISAPSGPEAEETGKAFKIWWYVVSTDSGRVLREYRTFPPAGGWWIREDSKQGTSLVRDATQLQK